MARNTKKPRKSNLSRHKNFRPLTGKKLQIFLFVLLFGVIGVAYLLKTEALCACGGSGLSVPRSKILYISSAQVGQTAWSPRVLAYTDGNREPWCADFVSWVYKEAGYPFSSGLSGGWRWPIASEDYRQLPSLKNYTQYIGKYKARGTYTPVTGDIIFFDPAKLSSGGFGFSHVGIVDRVQYGTGYGTVVHTIEGNRSNQVQRHTYGINSTQILGYGDMF